MKFNKSAKYNKQNPLIQEENPEFIFSHPTADVHLKLPNVKALDEAGKAVKLILGAFNTQEKEPRFQQNACLIFLDRDQAMQDPQGAPYIVANFNNLEHLKSISETIGPRLDFIENDDCTFYFFNWGGEHIRHFASMLKPHHGELRLKTAYNLSSELQYDSRSLEEIVTNMTTLNPIVLQQKPEIMLTNYKKPIIEANETDLFTPEVEQELTQLTPIITQLQSNPDLNEAELDQKLYSLGLAYYQKETLMADEREIRHSIASDLKTSKVVSMFQETHLNPAQIRLFERFFKNVTIEGNTITAKGPKHTTLTQANSEL